MLRCLILSLALLASCGRSDAPAIPPPTSLAHPSPVVDPALFRTCPGWTGPTPVTMAEMVNATETEIACGDAMRGRLDALAAVYLPGPQ